MSDITMVFSSELAEIGLLALADPSFGERLLAGLQSLPAPRASADAPRREADASAVLDVAA